MPHTVFVNANPDWVTGLTQYHDMAVNEGDMVISEGISKVRNKSKIKIINP